MAKPVVILLFGSLALLLLCSEVSAGVRQHIEPIVSNVYYLQDYCALPEKEDLEEKYRHRRSSSGEEVESETDTDHDHDHDHDHGQLVGYDITEDTRKIIKYYAKKGYRKVKNEIEREIEFRAKWKQVFLDPVEQPSVVVRLWRPDAVESDRRNNKIVEDAPKNEMIQCKLLLRLSGELTNTSTNFGGSLSASFGSMANSTIGAVVNFLKLNKNPLLNDYRLRIVTSDPNMTQYWLAGRKLATSTKSAASSMASLAESQQPVAVDVVTHPQMNSQPMMKLDLDFLQMINNASKWLLIELETMNQAMNLSGLKRSSTVQQSTANSKDDTELVINLYTKSANVDDQLLRSEQQSQGYLSKNTTSQCPIGTFDCAGDGLQCIPSGLRCNGEDNCGNRFDELFNCGTVNLYYIFGSDGHHGQFDFESDGFWFAVRILILLFLICLVLYMSSLLCQCCCGRGRGSGIMINGRSPMVYVRSAKGGPSGVEPLLASGSTAGFGATAGRAMKLNPGPGSSVLPPTPPPSYFGNQNDNQKSNVNEYIYVNNNYGQPQGSTTVYTSVRPTRDNYNGGASAPPQYMDNFPPLYPNIEYPNYGGTNQKC